MFMYVKQYKLTTVEKNNYFVDSVTRFQPLSSLHCAESDGVKESFTK